MSTDSKARAAELKAEGNAFFVEKKWVKALNKFTQALELDNKNAILYSNRAACYLHLDRYDLYAMSSCSSDADLYKISRCS